MINVLIAAASLGSLGTLFWLFQKHIDGQPLLPYEPRRSVPWNALAPLAVLVPFGLMALTPSSGGELDDAPDVAAQYESAAVGAATGAPLGPAVNCALDSAAVNYAAQRNAQPMQLRIIWAQVLTSVVLTMACYMLLIVAFGATPHDLGLPSSWPQFRRDVAIGATGCLAALFPVYCIQALLTYLLAPQHAHPLIEELTVNHSPQMMASAAVVAVLAAPMFEETAFRLIFQGWLERGERRKTAGRTVEPLEVTSIDAEALAVDAPQAEAPVTTESPTLPLENPRRRSHGWASILISGTLFGAFHAGHGVAPASLVLLGFVLGYLYQRTHRIVPSIVCHMLFNLFSLGMLWAAFASGEL